MTMAQKTSLLDTFLKAKELLLFICAVVVTLLNLYLSTKIAPIYTKIENVEAKTITQDVQIKDIKDNQLINKGDLSDQMDRISDKVDSTNERVDQIYFYLTGKK